MLGPDSAEGPGARLRDWLLERTLPYWRTHGLDREFGGFHEKLDLARRPITADGKRVLVQARQIYVFSHAALLGAVEGALEAAAEGVRFLTAHYAHGGGWRHRVARDGTPLDDRRDLYDHAFVIFAMAWYLRAGGGEPARRIADDTLAFLDDALTHPAGGYREGLDGKGQPLADAPRRQNPHMHLLEALLAMFETTGDDGYLERAARLVDLARRRFVVDGTLREFFADDLAPATGEAGRIVEPGHHFEWVWLLHAFARHADETTPLATAGTLYRFAVRHGTDPASGGIFDRIAADGRVLNDDRRLWPQTEALKAHAACLCAGDAEAAVRLDTGAGMLLRDHLQGAAPGAWREHLRRDGTPFARFLPASSLYHLTFAITETDNVARTVRAGTLPSSRPAV